MNTKRKTLLLFILLFTGMAVRSAPLHFVPVTKHLPDGSELQLYVSGDEFFNYLHDEKGLPVNLGRDGYYYYQLQEGDTFISTGIRAGEADPAKHPEIKKVITPSWVRSRRETHQRQMAGTALSAGDLYLSKSTGVFNNLVIYIKFSGELYFTRDRADYETKFNSLTDISVRHYFREISEEKLDVPSYHFPGGTEEEIIYTDSFKRSHYQPYNAITNPNGYRSNEEIATREHGLLERAILWAASVSALPQGVNFDKNRDGIFDNISFIVRGAPDGWNDLLWPHSWVLYTRTVKIGSLTVGRYTFQMENVTVNTLSHEIMHSLGAPDLYHYENNSVPVGPWDIMASGDGHPSAWIKHKYGGWINEIPEITSSGTYTLKPRGSAGNNAYIIRTALTDDQFFVVEYRVREGLYESELPSSGMTIQRINQRVEGNADGPPDEVYYFRRNGTQDNDGIINLATFPGLSGEDNFNDITNPYAFLQNGLETGISISGIRAEGDSIVFTVDMDQVFEMDVRAVNDDILKVSWKSLSPNEFIAAVSEQPLALKPVEGKQYNEGDTIGSGSRVIYRGKLKDFTHTGLKSDEMYYYSLWSVTSNRENSYSAPVTGEKRTGIYFVPQLPHYEEFDDLSSSLPRGWKSSLADDGWRPDLNMGDPAVVLIPSTEDRNIFYTPGYQMVREQKYSLTFDYRNADPAVKESLFLTGGKDRYNGGIEQMTLFSSKNFRYSDEVMYRAVFKAAYSGAHFFGFSTGTGGKGVIIDNFRVERVPSPTVVLTEPDAFYPNPTSGIITVPATGLTEISVYRTDGIKVFETEIEAMKQVDLSRLGSGIYIITFTSEGYSSSEKLIIN